MVSCGEALIWTLRCTIAIVDLLALCVVSLRDAAGPIGCGLAVAGTLTAIRKLNRTLQLVSLRGVLALARVLH
jgi:hypothetical protein